MIVVPAALLQIIFFRLTYFSSILANFLFFPAFDNKLFNCIEGLVASFQVKGSLRNWSCFVKYASDWFWADTSWIEILNLNIWKNSCILPVNLLVEVKQFFFHFRSPLDKFYAVFFLITKKCNWWYILFFGNFENKP